MGRDYPDWGGRFKSKTQMMLYDLAELAARLGSPVAYERNGRVMFMTEFNDGLGEFVTANGGAGGSVSLTTTTYSGGFGALLSTGTNIGEYAYMQRYEPDPGESPVALSFYVGPFSAYGEFKIEFLRYSLTDGLDATRIYWRFDTGLITIEKSPSPDATIFTYKPVIVSKPLWVFMKLVVEPINKRPLRLYINDQVIGLEDYPMIHSSLMVLDMLLYRLQVTNKTAGQDTKAYIDRVIYTTDEPLND